MLTAACAKLTSTSSSATRRDTASNTGTYVAATDTALATSFCANRQPRAPLAGHTRRVGGRGRGAQTCCSCMYSRSRSLCAVARARSPPEPPVVNSTPAFCTARISTLRGGRERGRAGAEEGPAWAYTRALRNGANDLVVRLLRPKHKAADPVLLALQVLQVPAPRALALSESANGCIARGVRMCVCVRVRGGSGRVGAGPGRGQGGQIPTAGARRARGAHLLVNVADRVPRLVALAGDLRQVRAPLRRDEEPGRGRVDNVTNQVHRGRGKRGGGGGDTAYCAGIRCTASMSMTCSIISV